MVDAVTAAALAGLLQWEIATTDVTGPAVLLVPLGLLATVPLAVRRRHPVAVVVLVVLGLMTLHPASRVQEPQTTLLPFLLAVYSVAAHAERRRAVAGLAVGLVGILIDEPGDFVVLGPLTLGTWLVGRLVRAWREQAGELARLAAQLARERADNARLAVTEERTRIARELHDVVGHTLSLMVLQAGAERLALGDERPGTREALRGIEEAGRSTLAELRRLVGVLRRDDDEPELVPLPGLGRLPELVQQLRQTGLSVDLRITGERQLSPGLDLSAYRIVQEAVTNSVRHGSATAVSVCIRHSPGAVEIEVLDNGRPGAAAAGADGHGLLGMRERVALYGGQLTVGPRPGGGYAVQARLPLDAGS